jgi:hypothetical protein
METTVVRIRRKDGQILQDCDIYIGRRLTMGGWNLQQSKWANPFSVKLYGREKALEMYRTYILSNDALLSEIHTLRGKVLGCWCKPESCHGDILVELILNLPT